MASRTGRLLFRRIVAPAAYYGFIYFLSSRSSFPIEAPFQGFDKIAHIGIFGVFGLLLSWALSEPGKRPAASRMALAKPRQGEWEKSYRALQDEARRAMSESRAAKAP